MTGHFALRHSYGFLLLHWCGSRKGRTAQLANFSLSLLSKASLNASTTVSASVIGTSPVIEEIWANVKDGRPLTRVMSREIQLVFTRLAADRESLFGGGGGVS